MRLHRTWPLRRVAIAAVGGVREDVAARVIGESLAECGRIGVGGAQQPVESVAAVDDATLLALRNNICRQYPEQPSTIYIFCNTRTIKN